ncbi:hypothetical protein PV721_35800 [Streptomyces sp. MB09-01]|uniref:hypothetical protein n=1 Tax=Streptomyces sp. MB09-01 TaxID=3028666 RepID=UPI0029B089F3|nr:hypothetical protein [Streptomyces sp. MB09-01]MDX3539600.1 hypothetical protein [Streptomyces sp. MB09-01]
MAPPQPLTDKDQGGVAVYTDDDAQVVVDWLPHARLGRPALETAEADSTATRRPSATGRSGR